MSKILALAAAAIWLAVLALPDNKLHLEVVVLTHPQADHMNGLIDVLKRYTVLQFVEEPIGNDTVGYRELMTEIRNKKLEIRSVYVGDIIQFPISNFQFRVLWPERGFESKGLNETAIVGKLSFGNFDALLTSDAGLIAPPVQVDVLKVPHHGSKYGMTKEWLEAVQPKLAIISVGKRNSYGHPTPEALKLLQEVGVRVLRTDQDGSVEVVSDGSRWWVK